eukprot:g17069.t1
MPSLGITRYAKAPNPKLPTAPPLHLAWQPRSGEGSIVEEAFLVFLFAFFGFFWPGRHLPLVRVHHLVQARVRPSRIGILPDEVERQCTDVRFLLFTILVFSGVGWLSCSYVHKADLRRLTQGYSFHKLLCTTRKAL